MNTWFDVKVKYSKVSEGGSEKLTSEDFLFDAVSWTDAEARTYRQMKELTNGEFVIQSIKKSNISEVISDVDGEYYFKAKIALVTIDEKAGKEKKVNQYLLVAADDLKEALHRLEEGLSYMIIPYNVTKIELSGIYDVFPYFNNDQIINDMRLENFEEDPKNDEPEGPDLPPKEGGE